MIIQSSKHGKHEIKDLKVNGVSADDIRASLPRSILDNALVGVTQAFYSAWKIDDGGKKTAYEVLDDSNRQMAEFLGVSDLKSFEDIFMGKHSSSTSDSAAMCRHIVWLSMSVTRTVCAALLKNPSISKDMLEMVEKVIREHKAKAKDEPEPEKGKRAHLFTPM